MPDPILRQSACVLTACLLGSTASALTPPPERGSTEIVICYYAKAIVAGLSKCDPPSTLVGAVFGGCSDVEDAIRQDVLHRPSSGLAPFEMAEVAEIAINRIHSQMSPRVQGWILDAQTSDNPACRSSSNVLK